MIGKHQNLAKVVAKVSELTLESLWRKGYTEATDTKTMKMKND
jgi:hypothetical protein